MAAEGGGPAPSSSNAGAEAAPTPSTPGASDKPVVLLVIGMAGSGKTTLLQRINSHLRAAGPPGYLINLDPAVLEVPYGPHIDIRDTVNYKNVMKEYNLGPNGGIMTALNLFATRFDQVVQLCERRDPPPPYIVVDTPGQIEVFTWSASGTTVTEALASAFPTVVAFVVDTPRCAHPQTFMSNMLQAVSILYKTRLPLLLVFNKTDVAQHEFCLRWMADFEEYDAALKADSSYAASLSRSLSLVLEEFYAGLESVGVSAVTGQGMDALFAAVQKCAGAYRATYLPELERRRQEKAAREAQRQAQNLEKLRLDLSSQPDAAARQGQGVREGGGEAGGAADPAVQAASAVRERQEP